MRNLAILVAFAWPVCLRFDRLHVRMRGRRDHRIGHVPVERRDDVATRHTCGGRLDRILSSAVNPNDPSLHQEIICQLWIRRPILVASRPLRLYTALDRETCISGAADATVNPTVSQPKMKATRPAQ
jgi:hypothetical protein